MAATAEDDGPRRRGIGVLLREALYGTVVLMSVLGYLADHPLDAAESLWTVAGTAVVLYFAQLYASRVADRITAPAGGPTPELRHLAAEAWPVAAVAAPAVLFLAIAVGGAISVSVALTIDLWTGVAGIGAFAYAAARATHEGWLRRVVSTASGLAVGLLIVVLKSAL